VQRTVDDAGNIVQTTLNEGGEITDEDVVGSASDLPIEEEYLDDQGRVVSRAKDESGAVVEQVRDDEGNVVSVSVV
jgi:YD repeat-containing protein